MVHSIKERTRAFSLDALDDDDLIPRKDFPNYGIPAFSKPHQAALIHEGKFPAPVEVSPNRVAWRAGDLKKWRKNLRVRANYEDA